MLSALLALTRHPDQDLNLTFMDDKAEKAVATTAESKPSVIDEEMKDEQKGVDIEIELPTTPIP